MAIPGWVKGLAGLSIMLGLAILLVSTWTFMSVLVSREQRDLDELEGNTSISYLKSEVEIFRYNYSSDLVNTTISPWANLNKISEHFWVKMIVCTWLANIGGMFQIMASVYIICSSNKKVLTRSKYLVGLHFITFIILLISLFLPLGYDRDNETLHSITSFNDKIIASFNEFFEKGTEYIAYDINAYYFMVSFDLTVIFILMILTCCLMRCETNIYNAM